ncbi:flagellar basal-body rod protein FlgF [Gynuella sp.]|uniref:flagellar basal-body rod protein FlgF n=1 Tax=Gynuella sp. TaxID=2969146 RepID=UPI003D0C55C3
MDRALYVAMTGASQNMLSQQAHANNLANARTTGFKADWEQARSMPVWGEHFPTRAYALTERPASDFNDGPLIETSNPLDTAIQGDGFFAVQDANGQEAYTRRGDFTVTALGELINGNGEPVMGVGGAPVAIPDYEHLDIGDDGTITIRPAGAAVNALVVVDQIKLVNPDLQNFEKGTDGLFRPTGQAAGQVLPADPALRVVQGFVESSNVNSVAELTNIISLNRQYEMQVKMMKTADEVSRASESILQMS